MVQEAQSQRVKLTKRQIKEIKKMYKDIANDLEEKLKSANKGTLTERWLKDYQKQFQQAIKDLNKVLDTSIKDSMTDSATLATDTQIGLFQLVDEKYSIDSASHFTNMFTKIPQSTVEELVNGKFYKDGKGLSKRVWSNEQKANADFDYIIQKGLAAKKSVYELASDLAKYVNPDSKKDWDFKKLYPSVGNKKIEYNAVRLAVTSISHAYQLSMQRSCKANPYVNKIMWHTSNSHRGPCALCQSREGHEYDPDKLPLDHPLGVCYFVPVVNKSLEDIGSELNAWLKGGNNDMLDQWYKDNGGKDEPVKPTPNPKATRTRTPKPKAEKKEKIQDVVVNSQPIKERLSDMGRAFEDAGASEHWDIISGMIEKSPKIIQDLYEKFQGGLKFDTIEATPKQGACYNTGTKGITLNLKKDSKLDKDRMDKRGKYQTFFHEFGHLIDYKNPIYFNAKGVIDGRGYKCNNASALPKFINAIKEDYQDVLNSDLLKGKPQPFVEGKLKDMLRADDDPSSGVQDIYSGLTLNKILVRWHHSTDYWTRGNTDEEIASEAFAHMSSGYTNPKRLAAMQKWFPKACKAFEEIAQELIDYHK
jgi:hypothetical protein